MLFTIFQIFISFRFRDIQVFKIFNSRKGQRTNQKYWNLVVSDKEMQRLEETELLRKADLTVGVNCYR